MFSAQASRASHRAASPTTARPGRTTTKNRVSASASSQGGPHPGAPTPAGCRACGSRSPSPRALRASIWASALSPAPPPAPALSARRAGVLCCPPLLDLPFRAAPGASAGLGHPHEDPWLGARPAGGCWLSRRPALPGHRGAGETGRTETLSRASEAGVGTEVFPSKVSSSLCQFSPLTQFF